MKAADARTSAILCHAQITIGKYARQQTKTTGIGSQPVEILWPGAAQRKNPIIYSLHTVDNLQNHRNKKIIHKQGIAVMSDAAFFCLQHFKS